MAVAKSFKGYKPKEEIKVELTQKDIDSAVTKKVEELEKDYTEKMKIKDDEISQLQKELDVEVKAKEEVEEKVAEADKKVEEAEKSLEAKDAEIVKSQKEALEKQNFADEGGDEDKEATEEDIDKAFANGKLPIGRY
jgi:hypothetical protein